MSFQQPCRYDLLVAIIAAGAGGAIIREGHVIFGLLILALAGFCAFSTIVEKMEGRS